MRKVQDTRRQGGLGRRKTQGDERGASRYKINAGPGVKSDAEEEKCDGRIDGAWGVACGVKMCGPNSVDFTSPPDPKKCSSETTETP